LWAAWGGQTKIIQLLIDSGADVNARDERKAMTPLMCHLAALHSARTYLKVVQLLLEAKADPNIRANDGTTALSWAEERNDEKVIELLRQAGAEPGAVVQPDLVIPRLTIQRTDSGYVAKVGFAQIKLPSPEDLKARAIEWLLEAVHPPDKEAASVLRVCELSYDVAKGKEAIEELIEVVIAAPFRAHKVLQDHRSPVTGNTMSALMEICPDLGSDRLVRKA
jgi:hypothetical protein